MARHPRSKHQSFHNRQPAIAYPLEQRLLFTVSELAQIAPILAHTSDPSQDQIDLSTYLNDTALTSGETVDYAAESSDATVVNPVINGSTLSFEYANKPGTAEITVAGETIANGVATSPVTETFNVTVPPALAAGETAPVGPVIINQTFTAYENFSQSIPLLSAATDYSSPISGGTSVGITIPNLTPLSSGGYLLANGSIAPNNSNEDLSNLVYTPDQNFSGTETFQYTLTDAAGNVSAVANVTINVIPDVTVNIGYKQKFPSLHFRQPDGTPGLIRVTSGSAAITLAGADPVPTKVDGATYFLGVNVVDIDITNEPGHRASLVIQGYLGASKNPITVGNIEDLNGEVYDVVAKTTELTGTAEFDYLSNMELYQANNATLDIETGYVALSIVSANDTSIVGSPAFREIKVGNWTRDNPAPYAIDGDDIYEMVVHGNFDEGITLTGVARGATIRLAQIQGKLGGQWSDPWYIGGRIAQISVASVQPNSWSLLGADQFPPLEESSTSPYYPLISVAGIHLGGNVTGIDIQADLLGQVAVAGILTGSTIYAENEIGTISAASVVQSVLAAGVDTDTVPVTGASDLTGALIDSSDDFLTGTLGVISSVKLSGRGTFSDSRIIALKLGTLSLGTIPTSNTDADGTHIPFGVSADHINAVRATLNNGQNGEQKLVLGRAQLTTGSNLTYTDFAIDLFAAPST